MSAVASPSSSSKRRLRILGVDPGSRLTGYACVEVADGRVTVLEHGTLKLSNTSGRATIALEERLYSIYEGLSEVMTRLRPQILSIEKVFFSKNAVSALKLGQARGAAILTGKIHGLDVAEYSATEVKQAVTGHGGADKTQVARMLTLLLGEQKFESSDASDALAIALCHAQRLRSLKTAAGELRALHPELNRRTTKRSGSIADAVAHRIPGGSPRRS